MVHQSHHNDNNQEASVVAMDIDEDDGDDEGVPVATIVAENGFNNTGGTPEDNTTDVNPPVPSDNSEYSQNTSRLDIMSLSCIEFH
jgi:hypothetical protein